MIDLKGPYRHDWNDAIIFLNSQTFSVVKDPKTNRVIRIIWWK